MLYIYHVWNDTTSWERKKARRDKDPLYRVVLIHADSLDEAWGRFQRDYGGRYDHVELQDVPVGEHVVKWDRKIGR